MHGLTFACGSDGPPMPQFPPGCSPVPPGAVPVKSSGAMRQLPVDPSVLPWFPPQLTDLMANISWEDRYEKRDEGVFCPPGIGFENCTALLDFNMTTTTTPRPPEALPPRLVGIIGRWTGSASFSYQTVLVMYIAYYVSGRPR